MSHESVHTLIARSLDGDDAAWTELAGRVHEVVLSTCTRLQVREGLTFLADDELAREVAVRVLDRLRASNFHALASFVDVAERYQRTAGHADAHFNRWLSVITRRLRIDYLRSLPEYQRAREGSERVTRQTTLAELTDDAGAVNADTHAERSEVRRILDVLGRPEFPADQRQAVVLWLKGYNPAELAELLQLEDAAAATRLLRAARQRLRRKVATHLRAIEGGRR